jgi:hypothetical protein
MHCLVTLSTEPLVAPNASHIEHIGDCRRIKHCVAEGAFDVPILGKDHPSEFFERLPIDTGVNHMWLD